MNSTETPTARSPEIQREIEAIRWAAEHAATDPEYATDPHGTMDRYLAARLRDDGMEQS